MPIESIVFIAPIQASAITILGIGMTIITTGFGTVPITITVTDGDTTLGTVHGIAPGTAADTILHGIHPTIMAMITGTIRTIQRITITAVSAKTTITTMVTAIVGLPTVHGVVVI